MRIDLTCRHNLALRTVTVKVSADGAVVVAKRSVRHRIAGLTATELFPHTLRIARRLAGLAERLNLKVRAHVYVEPYGGAYSVPFCAQLVVKLPVTPEQGGAAALLGGGHWTRLRAKLDVYHEPRLTVKAVLPDKSRRRVLELEDPLNRDGHAARVLDLLNRPPVYAHPAAALLPDHLVRLTLRGGRALTLAARRDLTVQDRLADQGVLDWRT